MPLRRMSTISIDIETFSDVDLTKCGVYRYAESPAFDILLFGYAVDGGSVSVVDLVGGEEIPEDILEALSDPEVTKWAFNAAFERVCLSRWLLKKYPWHLRCSRIPEDMPENYLDPSSWRCTMVWSAYRGLPLSLAGAGAVLGLEKQKLTEGKELIKYFSVPCKPTKANGGRTRNLPEHDPEKWQRFKEYNKRDVEVEMSIQERLAWFRVPKQIWREYHLDQEINDRGIRLDMDVVENAILLDAKAKSELTKKARALTGLENPNSVQQLTGWLAEKNVETESLDKKAVSAMIRDDIPEEVREVLRIRQRLAKSSVKKYQAMQNAVCSDGRAHGMFQFYGANRTGRWSGRLIQLQNLPQNHMNDLAQARELLRTGDFDTIGLLYDDIPDALSQLIRTAFVPRPGYKFIICDFSAIEARVLAHLAHEKWRSKVFADGGDIYCASASAMFRVPVEKNGVNAHLRQKGKIAELALGYGGSVGALTSMGALEMGLHEEELQPLVDAWRESNPNIVGFWWDVDRAVKNAVGMQIRQNVNGILFDCKKGMLFIKLPSGRRLAYVKPRLGANKFGGESVIYQGLDASKKWGELESYGPKFVENIVQAISRDLLCFAMQNLRYCSIVGHVHDELIIECRKDMSLETVCSIMGRSPDWMPGIQLRADGYNADFYMKS